METLWDAALREGYLAPLRENYPWLAAYPWQLCRFVKKEYLCRFRERIDHLVFLLEGRVSVSLTPPHGRTHIVTWSSVNDLICGDVEVALGNTLASADLRCESEVFCLTLPIEPHREALSNDNSFLRYALARLSVQMVRQSIYTANNLLFPLENRMAAYILYFLGGDFFQVNLTHTAELMGASYRQLSRVMHSYLQRDLLVKENGGWRVIDRAGLEALAANIEETVL